MGKRPSRKTFAESKKQAKNNRYNPKHHTKARINRKITPYYFDDETVFLTFAQKNQREPPITTMKIVIQRVSRASVTIAEKTKSTIGKGFLILLGIATDDTTDDVEWLVKKIVGLRIFDDENGVMNLSIRDVDGDIMVVSQFTLMAGYKKGNRPSWIKAAPHHISIPLYNAFCTMLGEALGKPVSTGEFGADMQVELVNSGPVTICMDTRNKE